MLYIIGLGLGDEKDITVKGLEAVKKCDKVFLEHYTAVLGVDVEKLERFYERKVELADRTMVEMQADKILDLAKTMNVAFLVVGDPLAATTHTDLLLRASAAGIPCKVIHNASIMNAVASCGLQLYSFGPTVSIPLFQPKFRPTSFYDKIKQNIQMKTHTLCLLDIKVKEQTFENLAKGNNIFEPPRYMTIREAIAQLLEVENERLEQVFRKDTLCIGMARVGSDSQCIASGTMEQLLRVDFGPPLHALVIPSGDIHFIEKDMVDFYSWQKLPSSQVLSQAQLDALSTPVCSGSQVECEVDAEVDAEFDDDLKARESLFAESSASSSVGTTLSTASTGASMSSQSEGKAAAVVPAPSMAERQWTREELARYNGSDATLPVHVAVNGVVYDVSSRRDLYGADGGYHFLAGKDASRALGKSSLDREDVNNCDISNLSSEEKETLEQWQSTFAKKYPVVGLLPVTVSSAGSKL